MATLRYGLRLFVFWGTLFILLVSAGFRTFASSHHQDIRPPASQVLDLTAEALGWQERTTSGTSIAHIVRSGDAETVYLIKWDTYPASYYYYAGNQPGIPFGETDGYQWGRGCTTECNPPTKSDFFQFNFDFDEDGDANLDTPAGRYLGYFCEVTVRAPADRLVYPEGEALRLCTIVRDKAMLVRIQQKKIFDNACIDRTCPQSDCIGSVRHFDGACNPENGQCYFRSQEDCGSFGCDPATGRCKKPETGDLCAEVACEAAICMDGKSYYDPFCNPANGECEYSLEDCGAAGCNDSTGRCNRPLCGGAVCEPTQCIENQSFYDPECIDDVCQYTLEDCGARGCDQRTGRCNPPAPAGGCGGSVGLALVVFAFILKRTFS